MTFISPLNIYFTFKKLYLTKNKLYQPRKPPDETILTYNYLFWAFLVLVNANMPFPGFETLLHK